MVSVWVSPTDGDIFPHWFSGFAGRFRESSRIVFRELAPFIGGILPLRVFESQPEDVRRAKLGIARATRFRDFHEAQRHHFANGGPYGVPVDAVELKIIVSHRQFAVILAAMVREFDFDPRDYSMTRKAQRAIGRAIPAFR